MLFRSTGTTRGVAPAFVRIQHLRQFGIRTAERMGAATASLSLLGLLLALFVAADVVLMHVTRLPSAAYEGPSIVLAFARRLLRLDLAGVAVLLALACLLALALRSRSLGPTWSLFEHGRRLRALCVFVAAVLVWAYSTYAYNHFVGQAHLVDRFLLVGLLPLMFWRPAFMLPFLLVLLPVVWQFDAPIGGFSWSEPVLLVRVLVLVGAAYAIRTVTARLRAAEVVFLLACLIAAHYWVSGWGKVELGWFGAGRIHYMIPATYANGWLGFLEPEAVGVWTDRLRRIDLLLRVGTMVLECGALFFVAGRRFVSFFLIGWIGMHVGIVLVSGIFFWKWILLDAAFLVIFGGRFLRAAPIFTPIHVLLSVVLIATGAYWARPIKLAWYDVPVSYTYRVEAEGEAGTRTPLPPHFFAPFDYPFTLGHFGYLAEQPSLPIVWGTSGVRRVAEALDGVRTPEEVFDVERALGGVYVRQNRRARFEAFLEKFVRRKALAGADPGWLRIIRAPSQLWTFPRDVALPASEAVQNVHVHQVTSLFDGDRYREIRSRQVLSVELPPPLRPARNRTD